MKNKVQIPIIGEIKDGKVRYYQNKTLESFIKFCEENPQLRFWQSLFAWTKQDITVGGEDPFYWTGKLK